MRLLAIAAARFRPTITKHRAPAWGLIITPLVEIGSVPNLSRQATCGQAEHLNVFSGGATRSAGTRRALQVRHCRPAALVSRETAT
jgi:hypothetical protein